MNRPWLSASDFEQLKAARGTIESQHDVVRSAIESLHTVRAHLSAAESTIGNVLKRAEERARPATGAREALDAKRDPDGEAHKL